MKIKTYLQGRTTNFYVIWIFIIAVVVRIPFLFMTLNEAYGDRQTQTAFPARVWREDGFEPFLPTVPVFGNGGRELMLEFPIFQWVIYVTSFVSPTLDFAARLAGLFFFQMSAIGLFWLVRQISSKEIALAVLIAYQFNAFSMKWGSTATVDLAVIAFLMIGLAVLARALVTASHRVGLLIAAWLCLAASASIKPWGLAIWLPMAAYLALLVSPRRVALSERTTSTRRLTVLAETSVLVGTALVPFLLWNEWSSIQRREHNDGAAFIIGTLGDRTLINAAKILQFEFGFSIGGILVAGSLFCLFVFRKRNSFLRDSESVVIVTALVIAFIPIVFFTGKFAVHNYYSILVLPAVALFGVLTITRVLRFTRPVSAQTISLAGAWLLIALGYVNYLIVEGGQLVFGTPEERQEAGGSLATNMAVIATLACGTSLITVTFLVRRNLYINERSNWHGMVFVTLLALLALYILYIPVRIHVDSPRFPVQEGLIISHQGSDRRALLALNCWPPPTLHFQTKSRGLMITDVAISSAPSDDFLSSTALREYDLVVSCSSLLNAELNAYISHGISPSFVGYSYGGDYQVVGGGISSLEPLAPGLWSVK